MHISDNNIPATIDLGPLWSFPWYHEVHYHPDLKQKSLQEVTWCTDKRCSNIYLMHTWVSNTWFKVHTPDWLQVMWPEIILSTWECGLHVCGLYFQSSMVAICAGLELCLAHVWPTTGTTCLHLNYPDLFVHRLIAAMPVSEISR